MFSHSPLESIRLKYQPKLPAILRDIFKIQFNPDHDLGFSKGFEQDISQCVPHLKDTHSLTATLGQSRKKQTLRIGVVLSGGQAAGGHNVIIGLHDALKKLNEQSTIIGFCNGPKGIIENDWIELTDEFLDDYRNMGGFDMIGSGRTKIETPEQFEKVEKNMRELDLDGLVIIGGDDSNTNAALLADYFLNRGCKTRVIGVPKTIDGDLKNENVEISFGFDTACKMFSQTIGNLMRDTLSAKKYYFFVKLMGRSASHIALECALQTHPNMTLISEEMSAKKKNLDMLIEEICGMIERRAELGKNYGVILIPEGIIEFIPDFQKLIQELNALLDPEKPHGEKLDKMNQDEKSFYLSQLLSDESSTCFKSLPAEIQSQLLIDRDPHGNVQVSKIESDRMLIEMVKKELSRRKKQGIYTGKFSAQPLFCGYEGRSCLPSNFDSDYCYALGYIAALLIDGGKTGYMACLQQLIGKAEEWKVGAVPLVSMMRMEERHGKKKPVIEKALVNLEGEVFKKFEEQRLNWELDDDYISPGPIQFFGDSEITDCITFTLQLELERKHRKTSFANIM